jgi:hypothetical protein
MAVNYHSSSRSETLSRKISMRRISILRNAKTNGKRLSRLSLVEYTFEKIGSLRECGVDRLSWHRFSGRQC